MSQDLPRLNGKRIVITGATSGIGRAAALTLAKLGADLVLASRNVREGTALVRRLASAAPAAEFEFIAADLSSLEEVRSAAQKISTRWPRVDVLINNAGARFDRYERTADGNERTFATNHLGHFLLTGLLLGPLATSSSARIINVASSAAAQARNDGLWQFDAAHYDRRQAYAKSKLANLLFTAEFARRHDGGIQCFAVDPGIVATRFARNNGLLAWARHLVSHGRKGELRNAQAGADTIVYLASSLQIPANSTGRCFRNRQLIEVCSGANDAVAAASLWETSVSLTGINRCAESKPNTGHRAPHLSSN